MPADLVSILAIATDTELSAIPQYAQQDSNLRPKTPENIDSTDMECDSECDRLENIEHIENLLHTFDADYVQLLLEVIENDN
jgi:hypothetical protein